MTLSFDNFTNEERQAALTQFQEYLRFETVSATAPTTGAYKDCAAWLLKQLESLQIFSSVSLLPEAPDDSPVVLAVLTGRDSSLPILLLNSHYDVVPANIADWTAAEPFKGSIVDDDKIYGRGTQDMKCVGTQYIQALQKIHALKPDWKPQRDIVLTYVPDEEVGGGGMAAFLESVFYKNLPAGIALALDEGLASTTDVFSVFYGERLPWWIDVKASGATGHGSRFIEPSAVEQLVNLTKKALEFRQGQRDLLNMKPHENCAHAVAAKQLGDVTSLNITRLESGVRAGPQNALVYNCVPPTAECSMDIRISPHMEPSEMRTLLDTWCKECSSTEADHNGDTYPSITWEFVGHGNDSSDHALTSVDAAQNPWYKVFCDAITGMGMKMEPQVFPAATDSRFLRALGIRALGFSPMRNTPILLHENDEYIPVETYIEGIRVYVGLIHALGEAEL